MSDTDDRSSPPLRSLSVGSLLLLLGAGWLQHGVSKMAISGLGALLLIGALTGIFRTLDFSTPRLVNGTPPQLAWIRILVCLTALIFTVIEDLPAFASLPVGMRGNYQFWHLLNVLPGYSALLANPYLLGVLHWTTAALLFLALIGFQTRQLCSSVVLGFFNPGDPSTVHIFFPFRCRSGLPGPAAAVDALRGNVVGRSMAKSANATA